MPPQYLYSPEFSVTVLNQRRSVSRSIEPQRGSAIEVISYKAVVHPAREFAPFGPDNIRIDGLSSKWYKL